MNCHIKEDSARNLDVCGVRRLGVARCDFENVSVADSAVVICLADCGKVVVKAAVEAYLELAFGVSFKRFGNLFDFCNRVVNGLFAENVLACVDGFD